MWGLTGPEFLTLYWSAVGGVTLLAIIAALWVHWPRGRSGPAGDLGPYEVAMLAGGHIRVMHTALAGLVSRGAVHVSRTGRITKVPDARAADQYEAEVLSTLRHSDRISGSYRYQQSAVGRDLSRRMAQAGYLKSTARAAFTGRTVSLLYGVIGLVGAARLVTGLMNERPVGWLVASLVATFVIAKLAGAPLKQRPETPTRHGRRALSDVRAHGVSPGLAMGAAVLLPVAFAGLVAYPDPEMSSALTATPPSSGGSGGSSDGGGGDGGGDGGGGCGGCGGCG